MAEVVMGYCVKCKDKREMKDAVQVAMPAKGGGTRPAMKGTCAVCGTGMFKILPKSAAAPAA
ncbi:MAG: hypothetical protein RLZZ324_503 [Candidatus Parcubacteria bacterium]|jgi:hypothetical protein